MPCALFVARGRPGWAIRCHGPRRRPPTLNVGAPELLVIVVVALLVFGPNRLPELARQAGKAMGEVRRMADGFQAEVARAAEPAKAAEPTSVDD